MSDISEKFWDASIEELKKGYVFDEEKRGVHLLSLW